MCHAAGAIKHALGLCRTGPGSTWLRAAEIVVQLKSHFGPRTNVFRMPQQRRSDADVDAGSDWAHFAIAFGACRLPLSACVCVRVCVCGLGLSRYVRNVMAIMHRQGNNVRHISSTLSCSRLWIGNFAQKSVTKLRNSTRLPTASAAHLQCL